MKTDKVKSADQTPRRILGLVDSVALMLGIIIGVGIYETSGTIAAQIGSPWQLIALWIFGGFVSLCGALVYAELASTYPHQGGETYYLSRAFGRWAGFLFAWSGLLIIRPGSIAAMAFPFSRYALAGWSETTALTPPPGMDLFLASFAVILLTLLNIWRLEATKWTQISLTALKVIGLALLFAASLSVSSVSSSGDSAVNISLGGLNLALILILFTFGGWNELGYVAGEVRDFKVNIYRSILLTMMASTLLYVLVNVSFLRLLGLSGMAGSSAVAADSLKSLLPEYGALIISILVALSALGALNGLIITSARISYALGAQHAPFAILKAWDRKSNSPRNALLLQMCISLFIIHLTGSFIGSVVYTTAVVWSFFLLTGAAFFVLRKKDRSIERPYKVAAAPFIPLVFCIMSAYLTFSAITYDPLGSLVSLSITLSGLPVYLISRKLVT